MEGAPAPQRPHPPPLVREARFRGTGLFAPAVLAVAAIVTFLAAAGRPAPQLRIPAGMLGAASVAVVVLRELSLGRGDPARRAGSAVGAILTLVFAGQSFAPDVSAFLAKAFGPTTLGLPVSVVAAAATLVAFGPPLVSGSPSLVVLTIASSRIAGIRGRGLMAGWLLGLTPVPPPLQADRDRVRVAFAWIASAVAGWIACTAWRGI